MYFNFSVSGMLLRIFLNLLSFESILYIFRLTYLNNLSNVSFYIYIFRYL